MTIIFHSHLLSPSTLTPMTHLQPMEPSQNASKKNAKCAQQALHTSQAALITHHKARTSLEMVGGTMPLTCTSCTEGLEMWAQTAKIRARFHSHESGRAASSKPC